MLIISSTGSKKEIWEVFGMRESHLEIIPIHNEVLAKAPVLPETPSLIRIMLIRNKTKHVLKNKSICYICSTAMAKKILLSSDIKSTGVSLRDRERHSGAVLAITHLACVSGGKHRSQDL